jgi:subtilisin-like proprotein convertase family protein
MGGRRGALAFAIGAVFFVANVGGAWAVSPAPAPLPLPPGAEAEPNDATSSATPIASGERIRAPLRNDSDVDYYRFAAKTGERVFAAVVNSGSAGTSTDSDLALLASDGTTVIETDGDNGSMAAKSSSVSGATIPADGTYFLRVADLGSGLAPGEPVTELSYDLYLQLRAGLPAAETEPNGSFATASPLAGGFVTGTRASGTDTDVHELQLEAGDTVLLSLDLDPERDGTTFPGRLGFGLAGDNGNFFLVIDDPGASEAPGPTIPSEALAMTVSESGTYAAFVDGASAEGAGASATYRLSATVLPAAEPSCRTYPSAVTGDFLDGGAFTYEIPVEDDFRIGRASVSLDLTGTAMSDLDVSLRNPHGDELPLFTDIGSAAQTQMELTFDDFAAAPPFFAAVRPLGVQPEGSRLDLLAGERVEGSWRLVVRDDNPNGSVGSVAGAALILCAQSGEPVQKTVFHADFEDGDEGFAHAGAADEWERGFPDTPEVRNSPPVAGLEGCGQGVACFKTDLFGTYDSSSSQDLVSPPISLADAGSRLEVSWQQWTQLESASFDHASVSIEEAGGGEERALYEWTGPTMTTFLGNPVVNGNFPMIAGWGLHRADVSEFAGKTVRLRFHLDSDEIANFAGMAIDDVRVFVPGTPPDSGGPPTVPVGMPPPETPAGNQRTSLSGLKVKPSAFRASRSGASLLKKPAKGSGAAIVFSTVPGARVAFIVHRALPGRKVGGICRKAPPGGSGGPACKRYVAAGGFNLGGAAAANQLYFSGRVNSSSLPKGEYRLEAVATARGSDASLPVTTSFRILPPKGR